MNNIIRYCYVLICIMLLFCSIPLTSQPMPDNTLRDLSNHPHWLTLCHYKKNSQGYTSEINDSNFFLAEDGRTSPENEFLASYNAFFIHKDLSAISKYPARYRWLADKLNFPAVPEEKRNKRYAQYYKAVKDINSGYYIFATDYVNQPESIYGHTLVRLDSDSGSILLGRTINYAAITDDTNYVEYILKGVGGGFSGQYTVDPYYKKVSEYNYTQSRDLYEYKLLLSRKQLLLLADHLYELDTVKSPYYFFSSNCSYNILYLIDAACEETSLVSECKPWVVPYDTIRILERNNIIDEGSYRPSIGSRLSDGSHAVTGEQTLYARDIAQGKRESQVLLMNEKYSDSEKAAILDLSLDYYYYLSFPKLNEEYTIDDMMIRTIEISRARSRLHEPYTENAKRDDPLQGHAPFCIELGAGSVYNTNKILFRLRPSYHEFSDPGLGYTPGGELVFPSIMFSYENGDKNRFRLEKITAARITSLKPRTTLLKPLSWQIDIGAERDMPRTDSLGAYLSGSGGGMWLVSDSVYVYSLLGMYLSVSEESGAAPQIKSGLLADTFFRSRLHFFAFAKHYVNTFGNYIIGSGLSVGTPITRDISIGTKIESDYYNDSFWNAISLSIQYYF